jgi:hypothetical protein
VRLTGLKYIASIIVALGHCLEMLGIINKFWEEREERKVWGGH